MYCSVHLSHYLSTSFFLSITHAEHGAAKASSKVAGRETVEGLIGLGLSDDSKSLSVVQVASETDFAGRSETFVQLVQDVTTSVLTQNDYTNAALTTEQLHALPGVGTNVSSIKDLMDSAIVAIRENISVPSATKYVANDPQTFWVPYVHNKVAGTETGTAVAAVLVGPSADKTVDEEGLRATGKRLAMHIVAAKPQYLDVQDVPEEAVEKERAVLEGQIELENEASGKAKPPEIVQKMIEGRLRKFYELVCLKEQSHMLEEKNPKVSKVLQDAGVELHQYVYLTIGRA